MLLFIPLSLEVMKQHVDNYKPKRRIPKCQLSVVFVSSKENEIPLLQHQLELLGAKKPYNMITIELPSISGEDWTTLYSFQLFKYNIHHYLLKMYAVF